MSSEVPIEYRCPVCFDPLLRPTRLSACCNITLCADCMTQTLNLGQDACPFCRRRCLRSLARRKRANLVDEVLAAEVRSWLTSNGYVIAEAKRGTDNGTSGTSLIVSALLDIVEDDSEGNEEKALTRGAEAKPGGAVEKKAPSDNYTDRDVKQMIQELVSLRLVLQSYLQHSLSMEDRTVRCVRERLDCLERDLAVADGRTSTKTAMSSDITFEFDDSIEVWDGCDDSVEVVTSDAARVCGGKQPPLIARLLALQASQRPHRSTLTSTSTPQYENINKPTTGGPLKKMWDTYVRMYGSCKRAREEDSDVELVSPLGPKRMRPRSPLLDETLIMNNSSNNSNNSNNSINPAEVCIVSSTTHVGDLSGIAPVRDRGPMDRFMESRWKQDAHSTIHSIAHGEDEFAVLVDDTET